VTSRRSAFSRRGDLWRLIIPLALLTVTGCVSYVQAPSTIGRVLDAQTGKPIRGAMVTRPSVAPSWNTPHGLPAKKATTSRFGRFRISADRESDFLLHSHETPEAFTVTYKITAEGYQGTNVTGVADANVLWRIDLGSIRLAPE